MRVDQLDFDLPPSCIADRPAARREDARLLVVDPATSGPVDRHIFDWPSLVPSGALVVLNDTKVIRARLLGRKPTGGRVELLLVDRYDEGVDDSTERWRVLGRGLGELVGRRVQFASDAATPDGLTAQLSAHIEGPSGAPGLFDVRFGSAGGAVSRALDLLGAMPIPPYLRRAADAGDVERYQTVYARVPGAIAAPTAGLHLTAELLDHLHQRGVRTVCVTLHVGLGTFQPVSVDDLDDHPMHAEWMQVGTEVVREVADARRRRAPVVAVGTTVVRALESAADPERRGFIVPTERETRLLIQPGYDFRVVDALLTNFHLPRSTLLALVSAFAGAARVRAAYQHAIERGYRFYSYGDAMWLSGRARTT